MKSGGSLSIWFFIGVSDLKGFHLPQPGFLGSGGGGCVCHPANHFLVGGNHEIRWIVVDLVLHRRVSGGERSGDLRQGGLRVGVSAGASGCALQLARQRLVGWSVADSWRVF